MDIKKRKPCLVYIKGERVVLSSLLPPAVKWPPATGCFIVTPQKGATDFLVGCVGVSSEAWLDNIILDAHSSAITSQSAWDLVWFGVSIVCDDTICRKSMADITTTYFSVIKMHIFSWLYILNVVTFSCKKKISKI